MAMRIEMYLTGEALHTGDEEGGSGGATSGNQELLEDKRARRR
jgi:hypothetical protein